MVSVESGVYLHGGQYYESGTKAHNQVPYSLETSSLLSLCTIGCSPKSFCVHAPACHPQLYRLDLEEMTWNLHDNRGPALASHSAVAYASDIYIYGGKTRADAMEAGVKDLWKYKYVVVLMNPGGGYSIQDANMASG